MRTVTWPIVRKKSAFEVQVNQIILDATRRNANRFVGREERKAVAARKAMEAVQRVADPKGGYSKVGLPGIAGNILNKFMALWPRKWKPQPMPRCHRLTTNPKKISKRLRAAAGLAG